MAKLPKSFDPNKVERFTDLKHLLNAVAVKHKGLPYITYKDENAEGGKRSITFDGMLDLVNQLGTSFYKMGLMEKRVAILGETRYEWLTCFFATANGGGAAVPIDKELKDEQKIAFMEIAKCDAVAYSASYAEAIEGYARSGKAVPKIFICMDYSREEAAKLADIGVVSFKALVEDGKKAIEEGCREYIDYKVDRQRMCSCLFTSGTTGTSKAVMLSHANLAFDAYSGACCAVFTPADRIVSVLPLHHTYECTASFIATMPLGIEVCINDSLRMFLKNMNFFQPTLMVLVPMFVDAIVKKIWDGIEEKGKTKLVKSIIKISNLLRKIGIDKRRTLFKDIHAAFGGNLRYIVSGGAPLNPDHVRTLDDFGITVTQGYGTTECSPIIALMAPEMAYEKHKSCGYPLIEADVAILRNDGTIAPLSDKEDSEHGEVIVKGEIVMLGYMDNPEANAAAFTPEGYYRTGDIGYIDKDGFIYLVGRIKNIIINTSGKNIYPEEIEEHLSSIRSIKEVAVIGRYKDGGQYGASEVVLTALIYPDFDLFKDANGAIRPMDEIKAAIHEEVIAVNRTLPAYKQINEIELRDTEFEKTTSKKIIRRLLK